MKTPREAAVLAIARWVGKTMMPINDPWCEGEQRRIPDPLITAIHIFELAEYAFSRQELFNLLNSEKEKK